MPTFLLSPDQASWLPVANQILNGTLWTQLEPTLSTIQSLTIGLQSIPHPDCQEALKRVKAMKPKIIIIPP